MGAGGYLEKANVGVGEILLRSYWKKQISVLMSYRNKLILVLRSYWKKRVWC